MRRRFGFPDWGSVLLVLVLGVTSLAAPADGPDVIDVSNRDVVAHIYKGFESGDMAAILALMDPEVVWQHPGPATIPFAGTFRGHQGVQQFFSIAIERLEVLEQRIDRLVVEGDTVAAIGFEHMRVKATGREYRSPWVHLYRLREGRVVSFEEFIDTAALVEGFRAP